LAALPIKGAPALSYLLKRLLPLELPIVMAVPEEELDEYKSLFPETKYPDITFYPGSKDNVLERFWRAAKYFEFETVIRIIDNHILVCPEIILDMLKAHKREEADYVFSSNMVEGVAPEIIAFRLIDKIYRRYRDHHIVHMSYFFRSRDHSVYDFSPSDELYRRSFRLKLQYPEDHLLLETLFHLHDANDVRGLLKFVDENQYLLKINRTPKVTVYITNYNGACYLKEAIDSVYAQTFKDFELYYVDDGSTDDSLKIVAEYEEIHVLVNSKNRGIAYSSNRVLERAKGKYLLRLDADDVLMPTALEDLYATIENHPTWSVLYSGYYLTDAHLKVTETVSKNSEHHIAGSMISILALNDLKFRENIRHFDGQELYHRFSKSMSYGYLEKPLFKYRQHKASWSARADNTQERQKLKKELDL